MILTVTAPEPSKWAEERRREHMEVELEGVGIMEAGERLRSVEIFLIRTS